MSADNSHALDAHDAHGHDDHAHESGPHSTFSGYMAGFVLSIILTAIPFWLVMTKVIADRQTAVLVLGGLAVLQILVHMVYFLHMDGKAESGWTLLSTIFTVVFVAIGISGTLWVIFHMNANMMPTHTDMPAMEQAAQPEGAAKASP